MVGVVLHYNIAYCSMGLIIGDTIWEATDTLQRVAYRGRCTVGDRILCQGIDYRRRFTVGYHILFQGIDARGHSTVGYLTHA